VPALLLFQANKTNTNKIKTKQNLAPNNNRTKKNGLYGYEKLVLWFFWLHKKREI
jgi:hypothetical protein